MPGILAVAAQSGETPLDGEPNEKTRIFAFVLTCRTAGAWASSIFLPAPANLIPTRLRVSIVSFKPEYPQSRIWLFASEQ